MATPAIVNSYSVADNDHTTSFNVNINFTPTSGNVLILALSARYVTQTRIKSVTDDQGGSWELAHYHRPRDYGGYEYTTEIMICKSVPADVSQLSLTYWYDVSVQDSLIHVIELSNVQTTCIRYLDVLNANYATEYTFNAHYRNANTHIAATTTSNLALCFLSGRGNANIGSDSAPVFTVSSPWSIVKRLTDIATPVKYEASYAFGKVALSITNPETITIQQPGTDCNDVMGIMIVFNAVEETGGNGGDGSPTERLILSNIQTTLEGITTDDNYRTTVDTVELAYRTWVTAGEVGDVVIGIVPVESIYEVYNTSLYRVRLNILLTCHVQATSDSARYDAIENLKDDIIVALLNDVTRGGNAICTTIERDVTDMGDPDTLDVTGGTGTLVMQIFCEYDREIS